MSDEPVPFWRNGRVVVVAFLGFCFLVALGSVILTISGSKAIEGVEPPPPPPIAGTP